GSWSWLQGSSNRLLWHFHSLTSRLETPSMRIEIHTSAMQAFLTPRSGVLDASGEEHLRLAAKVVSASNRPGPTVSLTSTVWRRGCTVWRRGCPVRRRGCTVWRRGCTVWRRAYSV